jgi:hypothetical protein
MKLEPLSHSSTKKEFKNTTDAFTLLIAVCNLVGGESHQTYCALSGVGTCASASSATSHSINVILHALEQILRIPLCSSMALHLFPRGGKFMNLEAITSPTYGMHQWHRITRLRR